MSSFGIRDYLGLTVTYDSNDRVTYAAYFADSGKTVLINEFNISYASGDHPIFLGETLRNHRFNIGHGEFELDFDLSPSILGVSFNPLASGVVETGSNQFDVPWTTATAINLGEYIPLGGTAPFTYTVTIDADNKFTTVDEFLQLDNNLNIFTDTEHEVTVEVEDDNGKTFTILLTFTVVTGTFTNTYSMNFLDSTGQSMISSSPAADATTEFTVSVWINTGTNNRALGGRWDHSTDCHWYIGFDSARPRLWVSGDGSNSLGANVQARRYAGTHTSGTWEHICFTFNAGTINCYADGLLDNGTATGTPQASMYSSATQSLELGDMAGGNPGSDGIWDGLMDEFSFWSVEFTAGEVTELYNSGTPADLSGHSQAANILEWYFLGDAATLTGCPEITSNGANTLDYANGMVQADRSTNVPP